MPRLFSGLELPEALRHRLAMLRAPLPGAKWIEPDNLHITLRFAGDIDNLQAQYLSDELSCISMQPFEITPSGLGIFGHKSPTSLWAGIQPNAALADLARHHESAARKAGLPPEPRKFVGHITLARFKHTRADRVARFIERHGAFFMSPFRVEDFVLFSARPHSGGGPYVVEQRFPLWHHDYDAEASRTTPAGF